jgi:hypothetical protein
MDEVYDRSHVAVRIPEHDGLSTFILESLARGKEVIYKYSFDYCFKCTNEDELTHRLKELEDAFNRGEWKVNSDGIDFIADEFSRERILGNLLMKIQQIAK